MTSPRWSHEESSSSALTATVHASAADRLHELLDLIQDGKMYPVLRQEEPSNTDLTYTQQNEDHNTRRLSTNTILELSERKQPNDNNRLEIPSNTPINVNEVVNEVSSEVDIANEFKTDDAMKVQNDKELIVVNYDEVDGGLNRAKRNAKPIDNKTAKVNMNTLTIYFKFIHINSKVISNCVINYNVDKVD